MAKVDLILDINKVMVTNNNYDLFKKGFYSIESNNTDTLNSVIVPKAVLTTPSGKSFPNWIDPTRWGFDLNCNYLGAGPRDLRDFILKNGFYKNDDLYSKIQSNNVVVYDFNSNELEAYNTTSTFDYYPFHIMAKENGKTVFLLEFHDTHRPHSNKDQVIPDVQKTIHFASHMFDTDLQVITYFGDTDSDAFYNHSVRFANAHRENHYNLNLNFDSFEIWIDYPFSLEQRTIQFDDEFRQILHALNYPILNKRFDNGVLQAIDRFTKKDQQTNQAIRITYEEDKKQL